MTIRLKILTFQIVVTAALLSVGAVTWYYVDRIDYYFDRNRLAGAQIDSIIRMSAAMNRYSENVAELLLLGRSEFNDFTEAQTSLEVSLERLEGLILDEIAFVINPEERAVEQRGLERVRTMRSLYEDIDAQTRRLLVLRDQGRLDEAIQIFREEIEERLDTALEAEIATALAEEEADLRLFESLTNRLERQLERIISVVTVMAFLVSAGAAILLSRSLTKPIEALTSATKAISDGDLGYRIAYDGRDEFAGLAAQFDIAASRLEVQRTALLNVQAGLEHEVARRTGELEDANARLQKLDHMRMLFLTDIGHELRTPLTVLRGEAEIALRRGDHSVEDHRDTLDRIVQLTHQMTRLVEDLLFLARAEVDAIRFEMQALSVHDVLDMALSDAEVLAEAEGVAIEAVLPEGCCMAQGDAGRLTQALMIVIDNAIKYADPGSTVQIRLSCGSGIAGIEVRNCGPEIAPAELPFVFSRFYRARQPPNRSQPGTGLGLSIAKWIVEGHRGQIEIFSADHATTVRISLPLLV